MGQPLPPWLFPGSFLFMIIFFLLLLLCPTSSTSFQCLHLGAARGCPPSPRIVGGKSKAGVSSGVSPPAQPLGLSTADAVQNQAQPCKGVQRKEQACASLTPKQLGTPHLPPKWAGEPGMQDRASGPPPASQGGSFGGSSEAGSCGTEAALRRRTPAYCTASIPI